MPRVVLCGALNAMLLLTTLHLRLNAQEKTKRPQSGVISGRVFLITGDGELKVARMAKVYLLWKGPGDLNSPVDESSAGSRFMREKGKELANVDTSKFHSDEGYCLEELMVYKRAIDNVTKWSFDAKKSNQIRLLSADEDAGRFKFSHLPPGNYYLFAQGRAGFNEAVWEDPLIELKPGASIEIKLSSSEKSCVVTN